MNKFFFLFFVSFSFIHFQHDIYNSIKHLMNKTDISKIKRYACIYIYIMYILKKTKKKKKK